MARKITKQPKQYAAIHVVNIGTPIIIKDFSDVPKDRFVYGIPKKDSLLIRYKNNNVPMTKQANTVMRIMFEGDIPVLGKPTGYHLPMYDWFECTFDAVISQPKDA